MSNKPFFSLITATRNAASVLPHLLKSSASQTCRDFELLIQDGMSTDNTVAVAENFRDELPALSIVSEPDTGIYDAWNKALSRARGEWILFPGADDSLYGADSLEQAGILLRNLPRNVVYAGCSLLLTTPLDVPVEICRPSGTLSIDLPNGMPFPHSALLHRRKLFEKEAFSTDFRIAGDYEFFCRTLTDNNYGIYDLLLTRQRIGGISSSLPSMLDRDLEFLRISRRYFPKARRVMLCARIFRSALFRVVHRLFGMKTAQVFADLARRCRRKAPLWSKPDVGQPVAPDFAENPPFFSLLVATVNRKEPLRRLFDSLNKQTYRNFEVLIADQNPAGFLDEISASADFPLTRIAMPPKGVSAARNALLKLSKGDIIAFPDDDCWYAPQALERVRSLFAANPALGGILAAWADTPQNSPSGSSLSPVNRTGAFRQAGTLIQFYRREALQCVYFDPELGPGTGLPYGSGEDTDFLLQALARGVLVGRTPEVLVYHPKPDPADPALIPKVRSYAHGRMHLLRKHKFPLWFKLANIVYPLLHLPLESPKARPYRKAMFLARLQGFLRK